jgi:hypothetical protein
MGTGIGVTECHAPQAQPGDIQAGVSEFDVLHLRALSGGIARRSCRAMAQG